MTQLAVGKTYKTASGHSVTINKDVGSLCSEDFRFYGEIREADTGAFVRIGYYRGNGRYNKTIPSQFDIVFEGSK